VISSFRGVRVLAATLAVSLPFVLSACGGDDTSAMDTSAAPDCPTTPVNVVVSVDQWGNIVSQLGGACAEVTTVLAGSAVDPHDYEPAPSDAAGVPTGQTRFELEVPASEYGLHVDGSIHVLPSGESLRTDLSCTLFLTEPEDYEGGELTVSDTYGTHEVKLPAGDLILYPSTSLHRVNPVTRGHRTSAFFWLQSMVRSDQHRGMLFDLDQTIQRLRAAHGESEETVGLTALYHNLVRTWSEV